MSETHKVKFVNDMVVFIFQHMCLTIDDTRELIYAVCELESHPSYTYMQSLVVKQCISSLVEVIIVKKNGIAKFHRRRAISDAGAYFFSCCHSK